jgi:hypothetical protein
MVWESPEIGRQKRPRLGVAGVEVRHTHVILISNHRP